MISPHHSVLTLAALLVVALAAEAQSQPTEDSFSEANTLLFFNDHLADVAEPAVLVYDYRKDGTLEEGFTDLVEMRVVDSTPPGAKQVEMTFFSGERQTLIPTISDAQGNPVIMVFLQRDVNEMSRLTGGPWRHFQQSIKLAFAEAADVTPVTIPFGTKRVEATKITISPYLEDPERDRLAAFASKYYEFVLSDEVPGYVHTIKAVVPGTADEGSGAGQSPLIEEVLSYRP